MSEFLLRPENPPTHDQIESFARACILFAHRHGYLAKKNSVYRVKPMSRFVPPRIVEGEPFGFLYEDTYFARAKTGDDSHISKLEVVHILTAREMNSAAGKLRTEDMFRVHDGQVIESRRRIRQEMYGDGGEVRLLDDINLDNVRVPDDLAEQFALEGDVSAITQEDFADMTHDMLDRMRAVDSGQCEYSEKRKAHYISYFDE